MSVIDMKLKARKGATLLELAVSMAITALMFTILGSIFIAQGRFIAIHDAISETQLGSFNALDATGLYTASASQVIASATLNGTAYTTGTELVILELPAIDSNKDIIDSTFDYVAIGLDPAATNTFIIDFDADVLSDRADLTRNITTLVNQVIFRYNTVTPTDANTIDLFVKTSKESRGSTISTPLGRIYYLGSS